MKRDTVIAHVGRHPEEHFGAVNPPVYRASTLLFKTMEDYHHARAHRLDRTRRSAYARIGTPTSFALEDAISEIEGGERCLLVGSGMMGIAVALHAFLEAGDHVLVVDTVYAPTRRFCDQFLSRYGVEASYYDPYLGAGIAALIRPNTRVVYCESPGTSTFEVQDVPAIAAAAHRKGCKVLMDNTWGLMNFRPFEHGVDVSIQAGTKYIGGHSDLVLGTVTVRNEDWERVGTMSHFLGTHAGPDDVYLALRGIRTLPVRLERHMENALAVARWIEKRPEVVQVMYPALENDPGHALWKRDFTGACGLFGVALKPYPDKAVAALIEGMEYFGLGVSWGGYESLITPFKNDTVRTATKLDLPGPALRLHVGLEDPDDLIADLEKGFARLNAAG
ncbi:MAG: cystathionine beta-lyase [Proteobacteria bacterium]|nr:cystathionine beta-lyase [Pseudomonadota bacterium]